MLSRRVATLSLLFAWTANCAELPKALSLLEQRRLKCHNATLRRSGLSLLTAEDARKGGAQGAAIIPGKPDDSLLVRMVSGEKPRVPMQAPPLSAAEVAEVREWIAKGAQWPEPLRG